MKLEGVRVVDLSVFLPGPYLTMALADHGAEVIKVEPPGEGDPGGTSACRTGRSTVFFRNLNRGKKSVVLDLKTAAGRESLLALCDDAPTCSSKSFRPGVMRAARRRTTRRCARATRASSTARSAHSARTAPIATGPRTISPPGAERRAQHDAGRRRRSRRCPALPSQTC